MDAAKSADFCWYPGCYLRREKTSSRERVEARSTTCYHSFIAPIITITVKQQKTDRITTLNLTGLLPSVFASASRRRITFLNSSQEDGNYLRYEREKD